MPAPFGECLHGRPKHARIGPVHGPWRRLGLLRLVLSRGMRLTAGGIIFGRFAASVLTRLLGQLLYDVSPRDPAVFGLALAVMMATRMFACLLPAWRASRTDPAPVLIYFLETARWERTLVLS